MQGSEWKLNEKNCCTLKFFRIIFVRIKQYWMNRCIICSKNFLIKSWSQMHRDTWMPRIWYYLIGANNIATAIVTAQHQILHWYCSVYIFKRLFSDQNINFYLNKNQIKSRHTKRLYKSLCRESLVYKYIYHSIVYRNPSRIAWFHVLIPHTHFILNDLLAITQSCHIPIVSCTLFDYIIFLFWSMDKQMLHIHEPTLKNTFCITFYNEVLAKQYYQFTIFFPFFWSIVVKFACTGWNVNVCVGHMWITIIINFIWCLLESLFLHWF